MYIRLLESFGEKKRVKICYEDHTELRLVCYKDHTELRLVCYEDHKISVSL